MDANSVASATEKTKIMDLPTISSDSPRMSKMVRECILCGQSPWDASPFIDASPEDCYQGLWPWHRYKVSQCGQYKVPRDKECHICTITFLTSSHKAKFGTTKRYHAHANANPDVHRQFRSGAKRLISQVNESGESSAVSLKHIAKHLKPLETVSEDACTPCLPTNMTHLPHNTTLAIYQDTWYRDIS
jgi:protein-arginine kinase activator protein McsA